MGIPIGFSGQFPVASGGNSTRGQLVGVLGLIVVLLTGPVVPRSVCSGETSGGYSLSPVFSRAVG